MNAVISGTARRALLIDGHSLESFDANGLSKSVQQSDLPFIFGEGRDLRVIENADFDSIAKELTSEANLALALDLTLISLDEELEEDIRKDALQHLNEALSDKQLVVQLENILYACPLPEDSDLPQALEFCQSLDVPKGRAFLDNLQKNQFSIGGVRATWDAIPTMLFGNQDLQIAFQYVAVREGVFRSLVYHYTAPDPFFLSLSLSQAEIGCIKELHNWELVFNQWAELLRREGEMPAWLRSHDPSERARCVRSLAQVGGDESFRLITEAFDDSSPEVRNEAARSLWELQPDRPAILTRALREGTPDRRRRIGAAIASSGLASEAIRNLVGEDRDRTYDALSLLFLMSKAGEVEPLIRAIQDQPNVEVRVAAVQLLALSGQPEILNTFRYLSTHGSLPQEVCSAIAEAIHSIIDQAESNPSAA